MGGDTSAYHYNVRKSKAFLHKIKSALMGK